MGVVIDHLQSGHRILVIRGFTDARGTACKAGDNGVLRRMDLDWARQEISLDWERDGKTQTLVFSLQAREGPGSGRMREYFEVGDPEVAAPPTPASDTRAEPSLPPTQPTVRRPSGSLAAFAGSQPPDHTCLRDLTVACDCDSSFHRVVGIEPRDLNVSACLCCGAVTCTQCLGDDGRFHGNPSYDNFTVHLAAPVHEWLSRWPRALITRLDRDRWPMADELVRRKFVYLPAETRCRSAEELAKLESRLAAEAGLLSTGARLRQAEYPGDPPPSGLPPTLQGFAAVWNCLQLHPDSDLNRLLAYGQRLSAARDVAVDLLLKRPDYGDIVISALRSDNPVHQSAAHSLALAMKPVHPELPAVVIELLENLPLEPHPEVPGRVARCERFEALLVLILDLKLAIPPILEALDSFRLPIARKDAWLYGSVMKTLEELTGKP